MRKPTDEEIMAAYWAAHAQFGPFDIGPEEHLAQVRAEEKNYEEARPPMPDRTSEAITSAPSKENV